MKKIKGWRKEKNLLINPDAVVQTIHLWESKDTILKINKRIDFKGLPYIVIVDYLKQNINRDTEFFDSEGFALAYAKRYMEKYPGVSDMEKIKANSKVGI